MVIFVILAAGIFVIIWNFIFGILLKGLVKWKMAMQKKLKPQLFLFATLIFGCLYFSFNWNYFPSYLLVLLFSNYFGDVSRKIPYLPLFSLTIPAGMLLSSIFYHTPFDLTSIFKPFLTIALSEVFFKITLRAKQDDVLKLLPQLTGMGDFEQLLQLSYIDSLTGLFNRRLLEQEARLIDWHYQNSKISYAVLMADVDFFKQYNDTLGHLAGDEALKKIAAAIKSAVRTQDKVFRYGGEEFLIVLPKTSLEKARQAAERIRHAVARDLEIPLTISIGIGHCPQNAESFWEVVKVADAALYQAKNKGRNTVYVLKA